MRQLGLGSKPKPAAAAAAGDGAAAAGADGEKKQSVAAAALAAAKAAASVGGAARVGTVTVAETRRFAGQTITVSRGSGMAGGGWHWQAGREQLDMFRGGHCCKEERAMGLSF